MGGAVCLVHRNAILRFEIIPTGRHDLKEFDAQLRQCFTSSDIAKGVEEKGSYVRVCALLAMEEWTLAERTELYAALEALYED
jgi:hypothetical protein